MKQAARAYLNQVAELGCIVCRGLGFWGTPAEIHHIRAGQGMGQRASNTEVLPLCHHHHRTGGHGVALHAGQKTWEAAYGTERELLAEVAELLEAQA
jgi:hypothetical protein